jgi:2,3-bisphosphoglycerate-independent phosphoglycerate mutase
MNGNTKKPTLLLILDGFGYREDKKYNAIANASMPNYQRLLKSCPNTLIQGSGHSVGLPDEQMGNSEVGHLNMGAGRIVYQELSRIDKAIEDESFFSNSVLCDALKKAQERNGAVHVMGLLSPGGVHSHENQIHAMLELAAKSNIVDIFFHAFLDGRDTPPKSALDPLEKINQINPIKIASIMGRFYAMDRDKRIERTQSAFTSLTQKKAEFTADSAVSALNLAYERGETDEFVKPTLIKINSKLVDISPNDLIIFMNFRADRARQLTKMFLDNGFNHFVTLTQYSKDLNTEIAFPPQSLNNVLSEYLSNLGLTQCHLAETEKYAHVTFFFNGGVEKPYPNETRILVNSPKVETYDLQPEMSAHELTDKLVEATISQHYDFIVCNFANPDMVGHTGNFQATLQALETIDFCLGKIVTALESTQGEMILTADHGNAECMFDEKTGQPHTAHTSDPVPFIYKGRPAKIIHQTGALCDVAPTLLYLMGLKIPEEMTGKSLLELMPS